MRNLFQYVGIRHLRTKPTRTALTTLGVSLGVALYVAIEIINQSTLSSFKQSVEAVAGKSTLTVSAGETGFPEEKLEVIKADPGVKHAVPMIESRAYFAGNKDATQTLFVLGVDLLQEQAVRTYKTSDEQVIDDPLVFLNQPDSIIVTHAFARDNGLKIDSQFSLATVHGSKKFTVRGMLSPEGPAKAYGGAIAIMDIDGARFTFGKEGKLDRVDVVTRENAEVDQVAERLKSELGPGYLVQKPEGQSESMQRMVKSYQAMMTFFSSLALLVGLFLVSNSVGIAVAERKREIGTLRALGATRSSILILFLFEAVAMGALGALLGAALGRGVASFLVGLVTRSMSSQFLTKFQVAQLEFGPGQVGKAVAIGGFAAMIAALWPAFRATQVQPLEAMRVKDVGEESAKAGFYRYSAWMGFGLLGFLAVSSVMGWSNSSGVVEGVNQVAAMLGSALIGPSLVTGLIRLFRPLAIRAGGGTVSRLAQDNLLRNPRRTGSNVMSLMVGLILVILISVVNVSFRTTMLDWFGRILRADLLVSSSGRLIAYEVQPIHEDIGPELAQVPGIQKGPERSAYALRFIHIPYEGKQLGLKAYDEPDPELNYSNFDLKDRAPAEAGREMFQGGGNVVFVSENFVLHFKKKTGDAIELDTPTGRARFKIIGVLADYASSEGVLYMDRKLYRKLWNDPLVSTFGLKVAPGYEIHQVRAEIDKRFGQSKNLMTVSNAEMREQLIETIDQSFAYTHAIELAALMVGLLGLLNTLLISVMERTREIGMLRAVGMSRGQMRRMILQESLYQGGFGAVVAVVLGSVIAYLWITTSLAHVLGWMVDFHFPWVAVGITILTGLIVALIAGFYPARRAANIEIREALEYE